MPPVWGSLQEFSPFALAIISVWTVSQESVKEAAGGGTGVSVGARQFELAGDAKRGRQDGLLAAALATSFTFHFTLGVHPRGGSRASLHGGSREGNDSSSEFHFCGVYVCKTWVDLVCQHTLHDFTFH